MRRLSLPVLLSLLLAATASADPAIRDLDAVVSDGRVSIRFGLEGAFDDEDLLREMRSGLPTGFAYDIALIWKRENWFDSTRERAVVEVIATYNSITREYLLNYRRDRKLVRSETFGDLEELRRRMTSIDEKDLFEISTDEHHRYRIRVRARLMRRHVMFIIPRHVATDWATSRITTRSTN